MVRTLHFLLYFVKPRPRATWLFQVCIVPLWLTFAAASPLSAWAVDSAALAEFRHQLYAAQSSATNATSTPTGAANVFAAFRFGPARGQPILVASYSRFLGDSLLYTLGRIGALHRLFPDSPIRILHPLAGKLTKTSWFTPLEVSQAQGGDETAFGYDAWNAIRPGDFVFCDYSSIPAWMIADRGASGMMVEIHEQGMNHVVGEVSVIGPRLKILGLVDPAWELNGALPNEGVMATRRFDAASPTPLWSGTKFERCDIKTRILLGDENGLSWPREIFIDQPAIREAEGFLAATFPDSPAPEYAVINGNTLGPSKVTPLKLSYVARMKSWVNAALKRPGMHVLVTPPEPQFGSEIRAEMDQFIASLGSRAAYFPADRKSWLEIISSARLVVTQDSGFNWMSLIVLPPERVFTFFMFASIAEWRMPGQPFDVAGAEETSAAQWIAAQSQRLGCDERLQIHGSPGELLKNSLR